jgi:hypothetical protein
VGELLTGVAALGACRLETHVGVYPKRNPLFFSAEGVYWLQEISVEAAAHCKELVCTYSFRLPKAVRNATPKSEDVPASQRPKPNRRRT